MSPESCNECSEHDAIVGKLTSVSSKMVVLLALISLGLVVVVACVTIAMGASDDVTGIRKDFDVHAGVQNQRMLNIEKEMTRNGETLKRIEALLREE